MKWDLVNRDECPSKNGFEPVIMSCATGATEAKSPKGSGSESRKRMKAMPPFWKAVSIETAVIWGISSLKRSYRNDWAVFIEPQEGVRNRYPLVKYNQKDVPYQHWNTYFLEIIQYPPSSPIDFQSICNSDIFVSSRLEIIK